MSTLIGSVSYAAAAAAFLFLSLLLLASWRGRVPGMLFAIASVVTVMWAGTLSYLAARPDAVSLPAQVLEVLRSAAWLAFLLVLLGYSRKQVGFLRSVAAGVAVFCGVLLMANVISAVASAIRVDMFVILGHVVLAVTGLVLVEQLYRNVAFHQRWGIKFLCLGLAGLFVCDFYLYSEALLFRRIDEDIWAARGLVNALVVPLLAISTARNPHWSLDISISRGIVFHSTAMLSAAVYLLVMAGAGYYIRYFGGRWGAVLQIMFLFGAILLLIVILFSGTLRARLKVFLSKNFFSYRYDYRQEWLRFTRTLSEGEPGVRLRERSIQAIAELVDSPGGGLWLAPDAGAFEQVARWNMPSARGTEPSDSPLCRFLQNRQWVIDLAEYEGRREDYEELEVPAWLHDIPHAWLIVPLMLHDQLLGFVVLARSRGKISLNWEISDILKTAGRQAASYLAQLEAANALLVARQFESFNRMSAFVVHDLKNLIAQLALLLSNADKHKHKPAFQEDMIGTVTHSVEKMKRLLTQLASTYTLEPTTPVLVAVLLQQIVAAKADSKPIPILEPCDGEIRVLGHAARLERVVGHLVQNAIDATPPEGHVLVRLLVQNGCAIIAIADTGGGMSDEFVRNRLFRPFESTKAMGMGIGTYEARQYVRELGGRIEVESKEGHGTVFRVVLPLYAPVRAIDTGAVFEGRA